jgi:hypothetical protein
VEVYVSVSVRAKDAWKGWYAREYLWRCSLHPFIDLLADFHREIQIGKFAGIFCSHEPWF